jgi:hypothetical protein
MSIAKLGSDVKMKIHNMVTGAVAVIAIGIVMTYFFFIMPSRTSARIQAYRASITPGMTLANLTDLMGKADRIIGSDHRLDRAHHYRIPPLDPNTVVYFYPKEGLPYFNLFVFVDTEKGEVTKLVVDKLN